MLPYETLKMEILNGALQPGDRLREVEIANRLETSRTPVREAIQRLAAEGLVMLSPYKGATVKEYNIDDLYQAFNLRALIEGYAASLVANNHLKINKEKLIEVNNEYKVNIHTYLKKPNKNDEVIMKLIESNRKFHDLIIEFSDNKFIPQVITSLMNLPITFQNFYWFDEKEFLDSIDIHDKLTTAIITGEAEQAKALMVSHILHGRDYVINNLKNK